MGASKARHRVLCAFCGLHSERAREDLISHWMVPIVGGYPTYFSTEHRLFGNQVLTENMRKVGSAAAYKYPDVCKDCNNGWMSQREMRAKPLLSPMLNGEQRLFGADSVETIATWCFLKAVVYDAWCAGDGRIETAFGTEFLFINRKPPRDTQMLLGVFGSPPGPVSLSMGRRELVVGGKGELRLKMTRVAFAFEQLVVVAHLVAANPGAAVIHGIRMAKQERLVEIWPSARPIEWSPVFVFDQETLDEMLNSSPVETAVADSKRGATP